MSWLGCLLLFILMASCTADEPANWEFACGKHFRLQYHTIEDGFKPGSWEESLNKQKVQISIKNTDLVLSQSYVFSPLCYKCAEGEQSIHPCCDLKINHTNEWTIKIINKKEVLESKLRFNWNVGYIASSNLDYYVEIGDSFKDNSYTLFKLSLIEPMRTMEKMYTEKWLFEIPLTSTTININTATFKGPKRTEADGLFNNGTSNFHFHREVDIENAQLDNLNGNDRISKIRDNVINTINWGEGVPLSKKKTDVTFHWKTEKLNILTNVTFADFETRDTEKWFLMKAESIQWPQINFELNALQMTLNETYWGVGFEKSHWNQASWTYSEGNNIALSTQFNSDFPISSAVFKFDFINSTVKIVLNFLESQWDLELRKSKHPLQEYLAIITRTDLWTQQRRPFTILEITNVDLEFPENNVQSSKLVISSLQNLKSIFKNMRSSFGTVQVNDIMHALTEKRMLARVLDLILTVLLDGKLDEDVLKKVDHLELLIKKATTFVLKNLHDFVEEENIDLKELFNRSLRSIGGDYVEKDDKIVVKYSNTLIKTLPIHIYKELLAVKCVDNLK